MCHRSLIFLLLATPCLAAAPTTLPARKVRIPGTTVEIAMVRIPAGRVELAGLKPSDAMRVVEVKSIWVARTETTWDMVDPWMFGEYKPRRPDTKRDAVTFPSMMPYGPPDRGFGHEGYPAIGLTAEAARRFSNWLHDQTDLRFRLPTEAEWEYAARCGGPPLTGLTAEQLDPVAWTAANSSTQDDEGERTHPVGKKQPNAWGLYDTLGNVGEWVQLEKNTEPYIKGGHYRSKPADVNSSSRLCETPMWKIRDPQDPKNEVWLSDAPFAGFRVVCDEGP